jgi:hypothetical protein
MENKKTWKFVNGVIYTAIVVFTLLFHGNIDETFKIATIIGLYLLIIK